ncbi:hypothetical protein HK102_006689 [Quaeritorhiza haematococci]|nr:hypothetical protein HK102_006689 [Quaeritorhiza haematococci]
MESEFNVLLVGSGGREHALAWKLSHSRRVKKIFVAPGNGGTALGGKVENIPIGVSSFSELTEFAIKNDVRLVVPGPEQPLVEGIREAFLKVGIPCFGPSKQAARLEGSKAFSKDFMKRHGIPTATYETFTEFEPAKAFIEKFQGDLVVKASGLAAGKGVLIPETKEEAIEGLKTMLVDKVFGSAGAEVVLEEKLIGEEVSVLAFSDGYTVVPMPPAQDHKRAYDGDKGPNTGGMGAYAPAPVLTPDMLEEVKRTVLKATVDGMRRDGFPFIGVLYAGLMLTPSGPKVLEFNCRFGDPETQVVLPLLHEDCDLAEIMLACAEGRLDSVKVQFKEACAATVVLAAAGYPGSYEKGKPIAIPNNLDKDAIVFHAGTTLKENTLVTSGGRVLTVTAVASSLEQAIALANANVPKIHFEGAQFRKDIGHRALSLLKRQQTKGATYAEAGVDIDAGNLLVEKIKPLIKATRRSGADADIGGFGGLFDLKAAGYTDPVLVSGTDGVGTKLKIAHAVGKHDTIGIDLVAMSVNDVLVQGAEPLFFLDYFACSKLEVDVAKDVVAGIAHGCKESGCALIGGETAEMPGMYSPGDYDLAGFVVGAVERTGILPNAENPVAAGDILLGLPSSGIHSNGYSLVRHIVAKNGLDYNSPCPFAVDGQKLSLGEALLTPTRLYVKGLLPVVKKGLVKAMAHITGGGFTDNIPRILPEGLGVKVDAASWPLLPVFRWLKKLGGIVDDEMARTFNCGIGMVVIVKANDAKNVIDTLTAVGEKVYQIGSVVTVSENGGKRVSLTGTQSAWSVA